MRLGGAIPSFALCLSMLAFAGCGSGSDVGDAPDTSKIPTATLPATLPEPLTVGSGAAVQAAGGSTYTVKSGDTLAEIASRFGVTLDELLAANPGVNPRTLTVGQTITLPKPSSEPEPTETPGEEPTATEAPADTPEPAPTETPVIDTPEPAATNTPTSLGQTYTVQEGDIPVTIAEKFGITLEALLAANPGLVPTDLKIGQVIIIPPATAG